MTKRQTVRDRLWIFACAANSDYPHIGRRSVMTPVEGAFYLGVPNIIVVQSSVKEAEYGRIEPPFAQYAIAMRPLKQVVWSVVGSGGFYCGSEAEEVFDLAHTLPNFAGVMLDDFFSGKEQGERAKLTLDELARVRSRLDETGKSLDILVTLYVQHLDLPLDDYMNLIDVITLWTGNPEVLHQLHANVDKVESRFPGKRKMLGCYVVDYGRKCSTPVDLMQHQCETGLRMLREGRIEGIIFLGNTTMDLGFESVEWTREWIDRVGEEEIP